MNKEAAFKETFDLQYVITKVSAKNFFVNKNSNIYQFLLENCLKGVCDCVVLDRAYMPQEVVTQICKILEELNSAKKLMILNGKSFKITNLESILKKKHDKYIGLYTKYFYGFEKEGKSHYWNEGLVQGAYVSMKKKMTR